MKLYSSVGPNPRILRMFMVERGVADIPTVDIDIIGGENTSDDYKALNPAAQTPCLQLDSGLVLAEVTAICSYLDEITDGPSLIGATPEERAETRMWCRRLDGKILEPLTLAFRSSEGMPLFQGRYHLLPDAADEIKAIVRENWQWLDGLMEGREYICGDRFTLADMQAFSFAEFGAGFAAQPMPEDCANLKGWHARIAARPSAQESLHASERG